MKRRDIFRVLQIICLIVASLGLVFMFLNSPREEIDPAIDPSKFIVEMNISINSKQMIELNPNETALYLNYFDTYPCPYYSDRADLIAPEINRLAQMMRSYGMKVIFFTQKEKPSEIKSDVKLLETEDLELENTSPKLEDKCLYADYDTKPAESDGSIHHDIMFSTTSDYFVSKHDDGVKLASQLGVKYLIVGGMRCNYWLLPFFRKLANLNIQPVYIYDLSDVAYYRAAQKKVLDTHTKALIHFWTLIVKEFKMAVNHFALIDRLYAKDPPVVKFDGNLKAYYFTEFFNYREL